MKVSAEKIENQQVVLTIEMPAAELEKAENRACQRLADRVNIRGFRKGKAPRAMVERFVGKESLLQEAFDLLAEQGLRDALAEQDIKEMVTRPDIEVVTLEEGKDLVFKATVVPRPEVTLGEYKGLSVPKEVAEVTDEEVDQQIEHMAEHQAAMTDAPEGAAVEKGDFTTLDYEGYIDGEKFDGGEGKDYPLEIGSNTFIPGFEDQLIGVKIGEERDVNVKFPDDYRAEELAGKDATFHCVVHSIRRRQLPPIDDELAKKVSKFQTLDELKANIRENLEQNAERQAENEQKEKAIEMATENIQVEVPPAMIDIEVTRMISQMEMRLSQQGLSFEQYLQFAGTSIDKMREEYREDAMKNVRTGLMLAEVARVEGIKVTGEDIDQEVQAMAATYGATPKQVRKVIKEEGRLNDLSARILSRKSMEFIWDNMAQ